jgi:hypothetical protein
VPERGQAHTHHYGHWMEGQHHMVVHALLSPLVFEFDASRSKTNHARTLPVSTTTLATLRTHVEPKYSKPTAKRTLQTRVLA